METNEHNPIEFQEKLNLGQLEAKHTLKTRYPGLKYERSTTSRLLKKKINNSATSNRDLKFFFNCSVLKNNIFMI